MAVLSPLSIAILGRDAGLRDVGGLTTAIAIAIAESGGNTDAVGDVALQDGTWGPSYGLWQVRSLKAESGKGTVRDGTMLKNPGFNAKSMMSISGGGKNWQPWTTYKGLRYTAVLPAASAAAASALAGGAAQSFTEGVAEGATDNPITDVAGSITDAANVVREAAETPIRISKWLTEGGTWVRIAYVAAGAALLIGGAVLFVKPVVEDVAGSTAGRVLKGALKK